MESARANVHATMELLMDQWKELDRQLRGCSGGSAEESKKMDIFASKMRELKEREEEVLIKVRDLEVMEIESKKALEEKMKILDQRSLDLDLQQRALEEREMEMSCELELIKRRKAALDLREKKVTNLEESLELKKMMLDMKMASISGGVSSQSKSTQEPELRPAKISKRSEQFQASGSVRNVQGRGELEFSLTISKTQAIRSYMTVPVWFWNKYDMSKKEYVILSTDKGDFHLGVRHYLGIVQFYNGWREFFTENGLSIGMRCLFRLKENTVNGDASGFSMEVSVVCP